MINSYVLIIVAVADMVDFRLASSSPSLSWSLEAKETEASLLSTSVIPEVRFLARARSE